MKGINAWVIRELMAKYPRIPFDGAACAEVDPELFFPEHNASQANAKLVCRRCPVLMQCAEWVLNSPCHEHGSWGGMNERERRDARSARGMSSKLAGVVDDKCGTAAGAKRHYRANEPACPSCSRAMARVRRRER